MGMQRDNEMIRNLLVQFRDEFNPGQNVEPDSEEENYHIYLLMDAKLIDAEEINHMGSLIPTYSGLRITSAGHDFLEAAENDTIWNKAKESLKEKGMEITKVPLDVLGGYLKHQMKKYIGME